jgi:hypothetical protein
MDQEGLDNFTLARMAWIEAERRAVIAPAPRGLQGADQAQAVQAALEAGWNAGRSAGKAGTCAPRSMWSSGT